MAFKTGRTKKGSSKSKKTGRREGRHSNTKRRRGFKVRQSKHGNYLVKEKKKFPKRTEEEEVKQKLEKSQLKGQKVNKTLQQNKNNKNANDKPGSEKDKRWQPLEKSKGNPKDGLNKKKRKKGIHEQGGLMISTLLEVDDRQSEPKKKQKLMDGTEWLVDKESKTKVLPIDEELVKQKKGESHDNYYKRMCKYTQMVIDEVVYQEKLNINFKKNEKGMITKVEKDEDIERKLLQPKKHKKMSEERKNKNWKLKAKEKKLRKKEKPEIESQPEDIFLPEYIEYGDVVHAPPHIDTTKLTRKLPEEKKNTTPNFLFMEDYDKKKDDNFKLTLNLPTAQEWLLEEKARKEK